MSAHHSFSLFAKDPAHRIGNLAHGCAGFHRRDNLGHNIVAPAGSVLDPLQGGPPRTGIAPGPEGSHACYLLLLQRCIDLLNWDGPLVFPFEPVHTYNNRFSTIHSLL